MSKKFFLRIILIFILFSGCVSSDGLPPTRVITDLDGVDFSKYEKDLYQCRRYAAQIDVGGDALAGLVAGALFGAVVGSAVGDRDTAKQGAKIGAVAGMTGEAADSSLEQETVIRNCLLGRGYKVLN